MKRINLIVHKLFSKSRANFKVYILPLALSLWGISNVFYWEIYKGYKACMFCKWHRGLYLALFISLLCLCKYKKLLLKLAIVLILCAENIVSAIQIFGAICNPLMCRRISMPEKLNFIFASSCLILILVYEFYVVIKRKKVKT